MSAEGNAYLSGDEFHVLGTLGVAVASPVLGTSLVSAVLAQATVGVHLNEVESAVDTARNLGDIDVEGELLVKEVEHGVFGVGLHEIDSTTNVSPRALGEELDGQGVTARGNAVGLLVVGTLESALLGTGSTVRADGGVPGVPGVAVGEAVRDVQPTPVGVEDNLAVALRGAAASCTLLPRKTRMGLCYLPANLLAMGDSEKAKRSKS
jgi:hypothetical protein